jgi:hypothetical protein
MRWGYATLLAAGAAVAQSEPPSDLEARLLAVGLDLPIAPAPPVPGASQDDELAEVKIIGDKAKSRRAIAAWLRLLPGTYDNEGTLTYGQQGSGGKKMPATGTSVCAVIGKGAGVQCMMTLRVPGEDTHLNPGMMLFGLDIERPLIRYMSVDDTGVSTGSTGDLRGDMVRFRTPCIATGARDCFSTTSILAAAGADRILYQLEIEVDGRVQARFDITQLRVK